MISSCVAMASACSSAAPVSSSWPFLASRACTSASEMLIPRPLSASRSPSIAADRISDTSAADFVPPDHLDSAPERSRTSVDILAACSALNPMGLSKSAKLAASPTTSRDDVPNAFLFASAHFSTVPRLPSNTAEDLASSSPIRRDTAIESAPTLSRPAPMARDAPTATRLARFIFSPKEPTLALALSVAPLVWSLARIKMSTTLLTMAPHSRRGAPGPPAAACVAARHPRALARWEGSRIARRLRG